MALETQMIDISMTKGVDTKMVSNTNLDTMFTAINNMRSDNIGGFTPRVGFTQTTSGTFTSPAWLAANKTTAVYSNGRAAGGDLAGSTITAAPGTLRRRAFTSQVDNDPLWVACATQSSKVLTAWSYAVVTSPGPPTGLQWYDPALDAVTYGSGISDFFVELQVTSGLSQALIWGLSPGGALSVYGVPVDGGASALTVSNGGITIARFDVVYHAGSGGYFMIYVEGTNTKLVKYTLSGSTITAGSPTTLTANASANVSIAMVAGNGGTTYIGCAYYIAATPVLKAELRSTALASVSIATGASPASPIWSLGVCDSLSTNPLMCTYNQYTSSFLPKAGAFTLSTSSTVSSTGADTAPFGTASRPVAISVSGTYLPFTAAVDIRNVATYAAAGFGPITSAGQTQSYRWNVGSAVGLFMHRGANIATVGARYCIPQVWEGRTEDITVATAGFGTLSTQQVAGLIIVDETQSCYSQLLPFGTAQIVAGGECYSMDSQALSPAGAFPIPAILASTFAEAGGGSLTVTSRYSYRLLKTWCDSLGNIMECVSPPFAMTTTGGNQTIGFTIPAQAFYLAQTPPTYGAKVQIKVYRTEANGSIHYFVPSKAYFATAVVADTTADTALIFSDALTYDGGELEDREMGHMAHMTTWQGRLVALPSDSDSTAFYSKPQEDYRGVRFADGLQIAFPQAKGGLVGLAGMDFTLYGFAQNEIYTVSGQPAGATGQDSSLGSPELRFAGIGCTSAKSILVTTKGIAFQSAKGVYMILRNQEMTFIGEGPFSSRSTTIVGAYVDSDRPELHYTLSTGVEWVYNWDQNLWTSFTLPDTPLCTALRGSTPIFLGSTGIWETASNSSEVIPLTMTSAWITTGKIQGFQRIRNLMLLLDYVAAHTLTVSIYTDYDEVTPVQTYTISTATLSTLTPYQIRLNLQNQKCEALKIKITSPTAGWKITGLSAEVGVKPNHYKPRTAPNTF